MLLCFLFAFLSALHSENKSVGLCCFKTKWCMCRMPWHLDLQTTRGIAISFEKQACHCYFCGISLILCKSLLDCIKHWSQPFLGGPLSSWITWCKEQPMWWERLVTGSWIILDVYAIAAMLGTKILLCMSLSLKRVSTYAKIQSWSITVCPKWCACRVVEAVHTLRNGCTSQCSSPFLPGAVKQ